jgi:hypothetical protein
MKGILRLLWMLLGTYIALRQVKECEEELMIRVMSQGRAEGKLEIWVE